MFQFLLFAVISHFIFVSSAHASLIITEILADPPAGLAGDANGDGIGSTSQDEFIEFFNDSVMPLDISNWFVNDALATRHVFLGGTILDPYGYLTVFGGGTFPQTVFKQKASTGALSLNNIGDSVQIFNAGASLTEAVDYNSSGNHDQSIVRIPENASGVFVLHSGVPFYEGKLFSPGYGMNTAPMVATPEPNSMSILGLGLVGLNVLRRRKHEKLDIRHSHR